MDSDARQKIYDMHGTINRVETKVDQIAAVQEKHDERIRVNSQEIEDLAGFKMKIIGAIAVVGTLLSLIATISASTVP